jgi:RNA-directed DNA polymerase
VTHGRRDPAEAKAPGNAGDMQTAGDFPRKDVEVSNEPGNNPPAVVQARGPQGMPERRGKWPDPDQRRELREKVCRGQKLIFELSWRGEKRTAYRLMLTLVDTYAFRMTAVEKVTCIAGGRYTPGVDGLIVTKDEERQELAEYLKEWKTHVPKPVMVMLIPKKDGKTRRLGIPIVKDRAVATLFRLLMEPFWEARFEPHSYGFRPKRSALNCVHSTADVIASALRGGSLTKQAGTPLPSELYIYDADISGCFDNIEHEYLLKKLGSCPFKHVIRRMLKAGAMGKLGFEKCEKGTPQGNPLSPLLANIVLHGMEEKLHLYKNPKDRNVPPANRKLLAPSNRVKKYRHVHCYRYADDFIHFGKDPATLNNAIKATTEHLADAGLEINKLKTRTVMLEDTFKFLGFHFGLKWRKGKTVFRFWPDRKRVDVFLGKIKEVMNRYRNARKNDLETMILTINRMIKGWMNYFRWSDMGETASYMDHRLWEICWFWAKKRHHGRGRRSTWRLYFQGTYPKHRFHWNNVLMERFYDLWDARAWFKWRKPCLFFNPYVSKPSPGDIPQCGNPKFPSGARNTKGTREAGKQ